MNLSIENLKHFEVLANLQNINKTAQQLAISPSAISFSLTKIESEVGVKLFNRVGKRIFLNSAGREFLEKTQKVLSEFSKLGALKVSEAKFKGNYKIGGSHWLAAKVLARVCCKITKEHTELSSEIKSMDTFRLTTEILTGQIDFALCFNTDPHPEIIQNVVHKGELKILVSKSHPMAEMSFKEWQKVINDFPYVAHKSGKSIERCDNHPIFETFGIRPQVSTLWDSDEVGLELLSHSDSWTLVPDVIALHSKTHVFLDLPKGWVAPYTVSMLYSSMTNQLDVIKRFEEEIKASLS